MASYYLKGYTTPDGVNSARTCANGRISWV